MTTEELSAKIIELAAQAFNVDAASITAETAIKNLGAKSIQTVAFNSMIENELGIGIPIREVMKFKTVGEIIDRAAQEL